MKNRPPVASIITIGDELLIGQVIDTNSAWIAGELNKIGIWVKRRVAVGDDNDAIRTALDEESTRSELVILTGGLGPTADDITKPLLCSYFGGRLIVNEAVLQHVKYLSEVIYKRPFIERNAKQAEVPDVCTVLHNERGSAPGMWFEKNKTVFIALPGVPFEMKGIMTDVAIPKIKNHFPAGVVTHRTLVTWGIGESFIAEKIQSWEERLPESIKIAYLPHYGMVRLRLTARTTTPDKSDTRLD
ncbi:MAG TPA: molybdopterin-binding protein, partial [Flavitalea sp.]|nr:molybdopterin-binding protein [Flavitalea sp.]